MDMYEYVEQTAELVKKRSKNVYEEENHSYMLGYMQSHMKYVLNALETTLTTKQKAILNMELDALKRRVEFGS